MANYESKPQRGELFIAKRTKNQANKVKGRWTQSVREVDDAPRYRGTATGIHADGKDYRKNNTDAPLPRREYSIRSDYNVMNRTNITSITKYGRIHEQDHAKMIRKDGAADVILVEEEGCRIYYKTSDSNAALQKNGEAPMKNNGVAVRKEWDEKNAKASDEVKL